MNFTLIVCLSLIVFAAYKVKEVVDRNNLKEKGQKHLIISSILLVLFFITNLTLPYPESLYWFLLIGTVIAISILSSDVIKSEYQRFKSLDKKKRILNLLFYSSLLVLININF